MFRPPPWHKGARAAFTLIELMVVVGIMVILCLLLFPAGLRALDSARRSACSSNLRQIGVAMRLYAGENDGALPYAYFTDSPNTANSCWDILISPYLLGKTIGMSTWAPVLKCPADKTPDARQFGWTTSRRSYSMIRGYAYGWPATAGVGVCLSAANDPRIQTPSGIRLANISDPAQTAMISELSAPNNQVGGTAYAAIDNPNQQMTSGTGTNLHSGAFNYLFVDGHVEALLPIQSAGRGTLQVPQGIWTIRSGD